MPLYAFRCTTCGAEFEVSRRLAARNDPAACPSDGGAGERMLTAPSLIGSAKREAEPAPSKAQPAASKWSHFGHSHGTGVGGHSHGSPAPKPPPSSDA